MNLLAVVVVGDAIDCFAAKSGESVCRLIDAFALEDQKQLHDFGSSALKFFACFQASLVRDSALPEAVGRTIVAIHVDGECEA